MSETEAAARYEVGIQPTRVIDGHQIIAVWPDGTKADMEHARLVADALNRTAILGSQAELFQHGEFVLHSGERSSFKIDCDALTPADWQAVAAWVAPTLEPFGDVIGVPTGGAAFANALLPYVTEGPSLVVDDVLTTGASMEEQRVPGARGLVLFGRGPLPSWVRAVFRTSEGSQAELMAQLREALRRVYEQDGPRDSRARIVPYSTYAAMSAEQIDNDWDFDRRYEMHQIAQALAAADAQKSGDGT